MISVFDHPWLGGLFADEAALAPWTADAQLARMLEVEAALSDAMGRTGRKDDATSAAAARAIRTARIDLERLRAGTARDGLPVPDLVAQLRAAAGEAGAAVHAGATSQDVLDTALALTLRDVTDLTLTRIDALRSALGALARDHGSARLMGRTRMQSALPIRAGDRIGAWSRPLDDHVATLIALRPRVERLQLAGPVGIAGDLDDALRREVATALGLGPADPSWQTTRDGIAAYTDALSRLTGSLGKMGQDVCMMAQQGIDELALAGGGGSSAMAHKTNPVLAELLVTLARFTATQVPAMHHAMIHEQERSGAAWTLEWMIVPAVAVATCRALSAAVELCDRIDRIGAP